MISDPRRQLAEVEAGLLRAVMAGGVPPEGFTAEQIQAVRDALLHKRARLVAKSWPSVSAALGPAFACRFRAYAAQHPLSGVGGPLGDGLLLVREALSKAELTDGIRLERLRAEAHLVCRGQRVRRRRLPAVKRAWLRSRGRLVILLTIPGRYWRLVEVRSPTR